MRSQQYPMMLGAMRNISGIIAKTDNLFINTLSIGNVSLTRGDDPQIDLDCDHNKPNHCTKLYDTETWPDDQRNISLHFEEDTGNAQPTNGTVAIDQMNPVINYFSYYVKGVNSIIFNYSVTDYLYSGSTACSGIDTIDFHVNNDIYPLVIKSKSCNSQGTFTVNNLSDVINLVVSMDVNDLAGKYSCDFERPEIWSKQHSDKYSR